MVNHPAIQTYSTNATLAMLTPALRSVSAVQVLRHPPAPPAPPVTRIQIGWTPNYTNPLEYTVVMGSTNLTDWFPMWAGQGSSTIVSNNWTQSFFRVFNTLAADSNSIP